MDKIQVRYTLFGSLAKGGYFRMFESVSHPGIVGTISSKKRGDKPEVTYAYKGKEFKTVKEVLEFYKTCPPLTENKNR